ncbi:hypothetical protein HYH03_003209 [Edaphochlamys debaryana]|uniref:Large ribosomal subunit protein uL4m n=1 Tax=Edaphochlamys debaryana TaxID=47281 RepID=A0A835YJW3_9CHLO|nr:hypothetical protein HYH03_003209 [Edaphochlamys debaryana]|eukprot:KAG2499024.1 hypothetical protein HYH03_003209 [Edaphochlamys debaryana]
MVLREAGDEALSPHPPSTGEGPLTVRYPFPIDYYANREAVVYNLDEQPMGLVSLPGAAFNVPVRIDILHRVARYWRAKWQQGTHKGKSRGEVRGGGRKPRPQKKTGMSRQGSIRSPLWKGGGCAHPPRPRSHAHELPRATRLLGMRCALSAKINEGRFFVVDDLLTVRDPSSTSDSSAASSSIRQYRDLKDRLTRLTAGSFGSSWLLVDSGEAGTDGGVRLRKLLKQAVVMEAMAPEQLTVYHVLKYNRIVLTRSALKRLSDMLTRPHRVPKPAKHAWWQQRKQALEATVAELNAAAEATASA